MVVSDHLDKGNSMRIGAIDIGGTKIAIGIVDETGRVLARSECPTEADKGLQAGLNRMVVMLRQAEMETGLPIQGIGIGCTGPVMPELGTIGDVEFLPGWEGANLVGELSGIFQVPAAIENDADAAALGEWAWGAGRGTRSFLLITVGTGIGGGIVLDGKLYRGVNGSHPEVGHHVVDPTGPLCFCGAHGCLESLASGPGMERWAQSNHPQEEWRSARQLCTAAEQGDPLAKTAVERTARYLGLGMANLVTLFSPDMIALGGGLLQSYHLFRDPIEETIHTNCGLVPHHLVKVKPATLGDRVGLAGAARVWYNRWSG